MASLRVRLIAGLLVLAAAGLLVLGGVTYAEQRSFLLDRVDQQARSAGPAVGHELSDQGIGASARDHDRPLAGGGSPGPGGNGGGGPDAGGAGITLPPGTYGQRRAASGRVLGHVVLGYGQTSLPPPEIPATLRPGEVVTVPARGTDDLHYRVASSRDIGGGTIVVAVPLGEVDQTLNRLLLVEGIVIGGVLLALGLVSWFVVRLGLRPLDRMGHTAGQIAAGDLSKRVSPATARTEVGRLGLALNGMLARLEEAFAERRASENRLRRFLADASHELRTPLASIRGYAELFRLGAARDPAESAKAMQRIEQEAARMGVLVEDLLTLARLGEVREPIREPVDLAALARDAVDDARVTAPERRIEVHGGTGAVASGDPHQIHQVLANLLRNALVHTSAGSPVEVTALRDGDAVELAVRDHGPGLPPGDPAALFERFWRAEEGRTRGKAGAGLGLAIVAGIVHAHGGTVTAADAAGGGARFTVRLPLAASPRDAAAPLPA